MTKLCSKKCPLWGGQSERKIQCLNPQFAQGEKIYSQDGIYPTLRSGSDAGGRGYPNAYVAQAYAIGNGQVNQLYLQDKCGALNCMVDPMKVIQEVGNEWESLKNTSLETGERPEPQEHCVLTKEHMGGSENIVTD